MGPGPHRVSTVCTIPDPCVVNMCLWVEAGYESSILIHDLVVMALHLLVMRGMHWTWTLALAQCTLVMQIAKPNKWFIGEIDKLIYSFNKTKGIHIASKCNE